MNIFDTDVIIDFLKGSTGATSNFLSTPRHLRFTTIINTIELYQGANNKQDLNLIKRFLRDSFSGILTLTPSSSQQAAKLIEQHALSSGLRLADALIAAIALQDNAVLISGNEKHFQVIAKLQFKKPSYR